MGTGLYVHVPFCRSRCPYCAFYSEVGRQRDMARYVRAVISELEGVRWGELARPGPLSSVFFGGGTPSLLAARHVEAVLEAARSGPGLDEDAEVTLEANPGSAEAERFAAYREAGVTRLSLGVQSFSDEVLGWLGRAHTAVEALRACVLAREVGFSRVSLDLMFGIPGVSVRQWTRSLETALDFRPEHLSLYALTVEEGTVLARDVGRKAVRPAGEEETAQAYERAVGVLAAAGYSRYEVSNFALPGFRCRHNWACWHGQEYVGIGAAAHSFVGNVRFWNWSDLDRYVDAVETGASPRQGSEVIDPTRALREYVWLRLRTSDGVILEEGQLRQLEGDERVGALLQEGFLERSGRRLSLGLRGWLVADAVAVEVTDVLERIRPGGRNGGAPNHGTVGGD